VPHSCVCFQHVFSVVFSKNKQTHGCGLIWHPNNHHRSAHIQHAPSIIIFLLGFSCCFFRLLAFSSFFFLSSSFFFFLLLSSSSFFFFFLLLLSSSFFCFSSVFLCGSRSTVFSFLPLNDVGFDSVDELQSIQ